MLSTCDVYRERMMAQPSSDVRQDIADRSAYPAQIERQLTIPKSNLWPKQTHSNGVVSPASSPIHESIQAGWAADENATKSCIPRYKYAGRNYGLRARDVHFCNWFLRRVDLQTVMAMPKSPSLPTILLRGPFFEAMLQGNRILLTSQTRLMPLTCMN